MPNTNQAASSPCPPSLQPWLAQTLGRCRAHLRQEDGKDEAEGVFRDNRERESEERPHLQSWPQEAQVRRQPPSASAACPEPAASQRFRANSEHCFNIKQNDHGRHSASCATSLHHLALRGVWKRYGGLGGRNNHRRWSVPEEISSTNHFKVGQSKKRAPAGILLLLLFLLLLCVMKKGCENTLANRGIDCALLLLLLLSRNKISVQNERSVNLHKRLSCF
jgi:hypothetical protein